MAAHAVGAAQQGGHVVHAAFVQCLAHGRARHPQPVHLVALHARHVKAQPTACRVEHGVVARALGAEPEVVAHQQVAHAQRVRPGCLE